MKEMYKTTFNLNNRSVVSTSKVVTLVYTVLHSKSHHSITTRECSENQSFLARTLCECMEKNSPYLPKGGFKITILL